MPLTGKNGHRISSPCSFNKQHKYYFSLVNCNYMMPFLANEKALWNAYELQWRWETRNGKCII